MWTAVEQARIAGALPGLVARDERGAVTGWTFFVERVDELQIGAFTATAASRDPLLDALLQTPEARVARRTRLFGSTDAPGLAPALEARGFAIGSYAYLMAALATTAVPSGPESAWRHTDLGAAADLMSAAYAPHDPLRPFGGSGRRDEWIEYVVGVTGSAGCGVFAPDLSVVVRGSDGRLDGVALVTRLGLSIAHLAQLAVAPTARGHGLGAQLLAAAMHRAAAAGLSGMSLLVAADNAAARRLYAARGFRYAASFLSAVTADSGARASVTSGTVGAH